ncbi:MAG: extracellular matrix regulator RemB [Christensenellales bacterium]|jgi:hypothetical protein
MILHIGGDTVVRKADIIVIMSLHDKAIDKIPLVQRMTQKNQVVHIGDEPCKSAVLCQSGGGQPRLYLSPILPSTLKRRARSATALESGAAE